MNERTSRSWWLRAAVAGLLAVHAVMAVASMSVKSPTFDEAVHLTAGYSFWTTGDYRLFPAQLAQRWMALPILFGGDRAPDFDGPEWWRSAKWNIADRWFYESGNDARSMIFRARLMTVILSLVLGWVVFAWSRRLFGPVGGLLSLGLYAFSPTMLAHARLATADVATALALLVAVAAVWALLAQVTWRTWLAATLAAGALFLIKPTGVLLLPTAAILALLRVVAGRPLEVRIGRSRIVTGRLKQVAVVGAIAVASAAAVVALIWLCYGLRFEAMRDPVAGRDRGEHTWNELLEPGGVALGTIDAARRARVLPEAYLFYYASTLKSTGDRTAFMNGRRSSTGWATFFPYAFLVKTPLPLFVVLAFAGAAAVRRWRGDRRGTMLRLYGIAPLAVLVAVQWVMAVTSSLNIGHRHILVTYPILFIAAGAATPDAARSRWWRAGLLAAACWFVVESVLIAPHYLAYFNQLAGGPQRAYRHLVDSSLDWGQDLPGLAARLEKRDPQTPVYLSYFGTARPEYYGVEARRLPGYGTMDPTPNLEPLRPGVYCISATMLQGIYPPFGPWSDEKERRYELARSVFEVYLQVRDDPALLAALLAETTEDGLRSALKQFDDLRFGRLCEFLRQREPDADAGHSILIYELSEDDLRRAIGDLASAGAQ